ncbi:MAG TPA: hypothetical protein VF640_05320 [Acidimicrobiales bacterium]
MVEAVALGVAGRREVAAAERSWAVAVRNFAAHLPRRVRRWVVMYEPAHHAEAVARVAPLLEVEHLFAAGLADPAEVRRVAEATTGDGEVGYLEFVVTDGRFDHDGVDYRDAVRPFASWPNDRVRLCFDVWDEVFPMLFAERREDLVGWCGEVAGRVAGCRSFAYEGRPGGWLRWSAGAWVRCDGSTDGDYLLPVGEVACRPDAVDGELVVDGWVIGSIPFGLKYGRIHAGALRLGLRSGEVVAVGGDDVGLCRDVEMVMERVPQLRLVAEVGIGQSRAATAASRVVPAGMQWHERRVGLHLGLGAELPDTVVERTHLTSHHLDVVMATGSVTTDAGDVVLAW